MIIRTTLILSSLALWITGSAQFGQAVELPRQDTGMWFTDLKSGHLNGDGNLDVVFAAEQATGMPTSGITYLGVALGDGSGPFSEPVVLDSLTSSFNMQLFDMDGDADLDIVVGCGYGGNNNLFFQLTNQGDGTFSERDTLVFVMNPADQYMTWVYCEDINGDGLGDLAIKWWRDDDQFGSAHGIKYFLNEDGFDPLSFELLALGSNMDFDLFFADLDGIAPKDWVVSARGINDAGASMGRFDGTSVVFHQDLTLPYLGRVSAVAELNGEGFADLLVTSHSEIWLYENDGTGSYPAPAVPLDIDLPSAGSFQRLDIGDMDSNGDLDLIIIWLDATHRLMWYENDGSGISYASHEPFAVAEIGDPCYVCGTAWGPLLELADLEGDGDPDLLLPANYVLFRNNGDGSFAAREDLFLDQLYFPEEFLVHLDEDSLVDILYRDTWQARTAFRKNLGGGTFAERTSGPSGWANPGYIQIGSRAADLDLDGLVDLLFVEIDSGRVAWSRNLGGLQFEDPPVVIGQTAVGSTEWVGVADLDGDGSGDLVVREWNTAALYFFFNDGSGSFGPAQTIPVPNNLGFYLQDLNGDGAAELTTPGGGIMYNDGAGNFDALVVPDLSPADEPVYYNTPFFDMDGDGLLDVWSASCWDCFNGSSMPNVLSWHKNLGGNVWGPSQIAVVPVQPAGSNLDINVVLVSDVDGDGDGDLIYQRTDVNRVEYAENLGAAVFAMPQVLVDDASAFRLDIQHILNPTAPAEIIYETGEGATNSKWYFPNFGDIPFQIRGAVFSDLDGDGVRDQGEQALSVAPAANTPDFGSAFTAPTGEYVIHGDAGSYTVNAPTVFPAQDWTLTTPSSYSVDLTTQDPVVTGIDFGFTPVADFTEAELIITRGQAPCMGLMPIWITINNTGTRAEHGSVEIVFSDLLAVGWVNDPSVVVNGNTITWGLGTLGYASSRTLYIAVLLPGLEFVGDSLHVTATANLTDDQGQPTGTFNAAEDWEYACAYDPNDKQVSPVGFGAHGAIEDTTAQLTYTIRFQNTGSAVAYNVHITDTLSGDLDWSRMEIIASSHQVDIARISNEGLFEAMFYYIMLPDSLSDPSGSQGFISFKLPINGGLADQTVITNAADIYFDLNPAIHTNTVTSTLVDCDLFEPVITQVWGDVLETIAGEEHQWYLNGDPLPNGTGSAVVIDQTGTYTVDVTNEFGCSATSDPFQVIELGITSQGNGGLAVVPNPFNDVIRLVADDALSASCIIKMFDVHGHLLRSAQGSGTRYQIIERGDLPSGIYILRVEQDGTVIASARLIAE